MRRIILTIVSCVIFNSAFSQSTQPLVQLGNTNDIKVISVSKDGLLYATGGADNEVILWDAKSQGQIVHFKNHNAEISAIAFDRDNQWIAIGDKEGTITCCNILSRNLEQTISLNGSSILKLFISDNQKYLLVQSDDFRIYDLVNKRFVYANNDIVSFDFSIQENMFYLVNIKKGNLEICKSEIDNLIKGVFNQTFSENVLVKDFKKQGKLIKGFAPSKMQFVAQNQNRMAVVYGSTLKWKNGNIYFTKRPEKDVNNKLRSICFIDSQDIAFSAGSLFIWDITNGKDKTRLIDGFMGANVLNYDLKNKLLLSAIESGLQVSDLRNNRTQNLVNCEYSIANLKMGVDGSLNIYSPSHVILSMYKGQLQGVRNFKSKEFPIAATYYPGSVERILAKSGEEVIFSRKNKLLFYNSKSQLLKQIKTDSRIAKTEPMFFISRLFFLVGGNYAAFKSAPWWSSKVVNSIYSEKNKLILYSTAKIPYGGQRIEVIDIVKKKRNLGFKAFASDISCFAVSSDEKYFAAAGLSPRNIFSAGPNRLVQVEKINSQNDEKYWESISSMPSERSVNIYLLDEIINGKKEPILKIKDSAINRVENLVFGSNNIISVGTNSNRHIYSKEATRLRLAYSISKKSIKFYDLISGELIHTIKGTAGPMIFLYGGKNLLYAHDNNLVLYSMEDFTAIKTWNAHSDTITSVLFDSTRNQLITSSLDGSVKFWDAETWRLQASLFQQKSEYILLTPDGYYTASKRGTKAVGYGVGSRYVSFDQFDTRFNRPDIVFGRLGWYSSDIIKAMKVAYEKRVSHFKLDTSQFSESLANLPILNINNKERISLETTNRKFVVKYNIKEGADPVKWIKAELNDIPLYGSHGRAISNSSNDSLVLELNPGENIIKLFAVTSKGYESLREVLKINYSPRLREIKVEEKIWTIHIGIGKFADSSNPLVYATKDANDLYQYFNNIKNTRSILLTNEKVTRKNIMSLRDSLMKTGIDDKVIVSYSGHGLLSNEKDYFLSTYDVDFDHPEIKGISYEEFIGILDSIPARKKLIFLDACHSGEFDKLEVEVDSGKSFTEVADAGTNNVARNAKVGVKKKTAGSESSFELMQEMFVNLENGNGAVVLSAATGTDVAYEDNKWNNGALTYCLLRGIKDKKADRNGNKKVDIAELKSYIIDEVPKLTKGKQKPTFRRENYNVNWNVN